MMKKLSLGLAAATIALTGAVTVFTPAQAAVAATSLACNGAATGWYVNPDEISLLPKQQVDGVLFDGPSLLHHAASGALADAKSDGSFVAKNIKGMAPLFKFETTAPYSTINETAEGTYWSTKIATGPGSQNEPTTLAVLAATAPYTADTKLISFGVGYANDGGNSALVTSVTYGGATLSLACAVPKPPVSTTPAPPSGTGTKPPASSTGTKPPTGTASRTVVVPPLKVSNPGQVSVVPNTSKGVNTGDGSLAQVFVG